MSDDADGNQTIFKIDTYKAQIEAYMAQVAGIAAGMPYGVTVAAKPVILYRTNGSNIDVS